jgi:hypothetical protein
MIVLVAAVALATSAAQDAGSQHTEWLFVQNAKSVSLEDGVLTLEGISPTTLFFSDRPEKIAAHGLTSEFVTFWGKGGGSDNFKKDPPNATLSIVSEEVAEDIVLTLANPKLDGDTLRYYVEVIEGRDTVKGGPCSLFVDVIGMPLTPVSVAGVDRRVARRTVRRVVW